MGKKGLTWEEKRQKIHEIYLQQKTVFNLKEIEKIGAKKGVVFQTIKDVNQSLVDDNLVQFDRIGAGAFFWSLPSMAYSNRQNMLQNQQQHIDQLTDQISKLEADIKTAGEARDDSDRDARIATYNDLRAEAKTLETELLQYERCDPAKLKEVEEDTKVCNKAAERWTDNLFEL